MAITAIETNISLRVWSESAIRNLLVFTSIIPIIDTKIFIKASCAHDNKAKMEISGTLGFIILSILSRITLTESNKRIIPNYKGCQ